MVEGAVPTETDFLEIIQYLNKRTGKRFTVTAAHKRLMRARFEEGHTVKDFKAAIDNQLQDPYFRDNPKYMRPQTLFNGKFDSYVNNVRLDTEIIEREDAEIKKLGKECFKYQQPAMFAGSHITDEKRRELAAFRVKWLKMNKARDVEGLRELVKQLREITG